MNAVEHDPPTLNHTGPGWTWDSRQRCFIDPDGVRYLLMYISRCSKDGCDWAGVSSEPAHWFDCPECAGEIEHGGSYLQRFVHDRRVKRQGLLF